MSYLSQKCRYETGGRQHSLSFPQRRKKTKVTDPEEVTNLTGWVVLSLRLEWEQPSTWCSVFQWLAQQHLFKALGGSWNERETASSPSLHGRGVQASYQVCSQSEALIVPSQEVTAFLSFLSCLCLLCLKLVTLLLVLYAVQSMCRSSFIQLSLSVSKHTTSVPSRTTWHLLQLWTGCGLFKFARSL